MPDGRRAEIDAEAGVARDDVARDAGRAADRHAPRAGNDRDAVAAVGDDRVAVGREADDVAGDDGAGRAAVGDPDAVGVARDDVALGRVVRAIGVGADARVGRAALDQDAGGAVAQHGDAVGADTDVVALDRGAGRSVADHHAVEGVAGDHIARPGRAAAEDVARAGAPEHRAAVDVAQRDQPGRVGADVVALQQVVLRGRVEHFEAEVVVAREHVARAGAGAADGVAARAVGQKDAALRRVGHRAVHVRRSRGIGADVVARDRAVVDVVEVDALLGIARDHVARRRRGAADQVAAAVRRIDALDAVGRGSGAGGVQADPVALERVVVRAADLDAGAGEAVDGQAADRAAVAAGTQHQALDAAADVVAIELDHRRARVVGLGRAVDDHRADDGGQRIGHGARRRRRRRPA